MNETTSSKKTNIIVVIFGTAFVISAIAASLLVVRANNLQAKIEQLQSQLNAANWPLTQLQPMAAQARKLPVAVACRKEVTGSRSILLLKNLSSEPLALSIIFSNPTLMETNAYQVDIGGRQIYQIGNSKIGNLEGRAFTSGDQIEVANADYDPFIAKFP